MTDDLGDAPMWERGATGAGMWDVYIIREERMRRRQIQRQREATPTSPRRRQPRGTRIVTPPDDGDGRW